MRASSGAAAIVVACSLASCSLYGDAPVYGAFYRVSSGDLRAASVAVQKSHHPEKIYAYRVISADEIWLYYTPDEDGSYYAARRTKGRWENAEGAIVLKEPTGFNGHE